jgi:hypothetical protein
MNRAPRSLAATGGLFVLAALSLPAAGDEAIDSPASFLSFESKTDGKCQNLSEGGKLQIMRNLHPTRKISFRLIRYFVDVRQNGRATGIAEPAGAPVKLGCTRVDGHAQRWVVERAEFTEDENE